MPPARFPGDGLDFRRPVTSTFSVPPDEDSEVIDLTNEPDSPELPRGQVLPESSSRRHRPRPPRFGRNIMADFIDLAEEEDEDFDAPSSPEVEFVSETTRPTPAPQNHSQERILASNFWRMLPLPHALLGSTNDVPRRRRTPWQSAEIDTLLVGRNTGAQENWAFRIPFPSVQLEPSPERDRRRDTYKPPSPAPEGFTRSAEEDDVAICPNCDEELGKGDELKQQIWISKPCGHVRIKLYLSASPYLTVAVGILWGMHNESFSNEGEEKSTKDEAFCQMSSSWLWREDQLT
ncbi:putative RING finger domain protein [Aspergillus mulundensis]|uniref:Uncharacterized protein n=1 Tax=Aspergillus mulundensis TaxID=1810919 RepID=A0A3D8QMV3_9EURO|nr:hypothetical protein DSM5745_10274 [Aspergillus mulundensis]RDW63163.1 hypothetical protein DSM5745_10274 [Aspergillus mulundensis]